MAALPTLPKPSNKSKPKRSTVGSIGKKFVGVGDAVRYSNMNTRGYKLQNKKIAKTNKPANDPAALQNIVNGSTRLENKIEKIITNSSKTYVSFLNWLKSSVKQTIDAFKSMMGLKGKDTPNTTPSLNPLQTNQIQNNTSDTQNIETIREQAEAQQEQVELETKTSDTLLDIKEILLKILTKMGKMSGGGKGDGILDTLADAASIANLFKGRGGGLASGAAKASKFARLRSIAAKGGLGKIAAARQASKPVSFLAKSSDKVAKGITGFKEGTKNLASKALGKVSGLLGFGTKLGGASGVSAAGAGAVNALSGATGVTGGAATTATNMGAQATGGAATTATNMGAQAAKPGFFGKLWGGVKNIGSKAIGSVKQLGSGALELAKAVKNPITFLKSNSKTLLKAFKGSAILSAIIEPIVGALNIMDIKSNKELDPEQKKELIGTEITARMGSGLGAAIGGALGSVGGPLGTILGGIAGSYGGEWVGGKIAEIIGPKGIYDIAASIPGVKSFIGVEDEVPTQNPEETPTVNAEPLSLKESVVPTSPSIQSSEQTKSNEQNIKSPNTITAPISDLSVPSSTTGQQLETQTRASIDNNLKYGNENSYKQPTIINNYYNNNSVSRPATVAISGNGGMITGGTATPPDESGMSLVLTREAARASAVGGVAG